MGGAVGRQLGVWFRRQVVVDTCIVDFLAPARKLVVEVDGGYHGSAERQRSDARRDKRLERAGYRVLRLPAELLVGNLEGCGAARCVGPHPMILQLEARRTTS